MWHAARLRRKIPFAFSYAPLLIDSKGIVGRERGAAVVGTLGRSESGRSGGDPGKRREQRREAPLLDRGGVPVE